jgi:hypothetical protein
MSRRRHLQFGNSDGELRYPWLPSWDEANVHNVWVPTPEEIEQECAKLREQQRRNPRHREALSMDSLFRVPCRKRGMQ